MIIEPPNMINGWVFGGNLREPIVIVVTHTYIYIYIYIYIYYITLPPGHHFLAGSCKFLHHQVMGYIVEHFV